MRRELLVIGKYLAGLSVALVLFVGSTAAAFLTICLLYTSRCV